jgi:hypothetical protein
MSELNITIEQRDASSGELIRPVVRISNRILPNGIKSAAYALIGGPPYSDDADSDCQLGFGYVPYYVGIGTDGTPVSDKDTSLGTEIFRNAITRRGLSTLPLGKVRYQFHVLANQANGYTFKEAGLFLPPHPDTPAGYDRAFQTGTLGIIPLNMGILFARAIIPDFAKTAADTLTITWDIPIANQE